MGREGMCSMTATAELVADLRSAIVHGIGQQEGALHRSQSVGTSPLLVGCYVEVLQASMTEITRIRS